MSGKFTNNPRGYAFVSLIIMIDGRTQDSGGFQSPLEGEFLALFVAQGPPQPLEIGDQQRQHHSAGTPLAVVLKVRFNDAPREFRFI